MSVGWSPTGILVKPGRSTSVKLRTLGEKISASERERAEEEGGNERQRGCDDARARRGEDALRWIGSREMPLLPPATRSVSFSISLRISPKS